MITTITSPNKHLKVLNLLLRHIQLTISWMIYLILMIQLTGLLIQLVLFHHQLCIQNVQLDSTKRHDIKFFPNKNNPFITKLITILPHFIHQQYKIQHYQNIQLSMQIQMIILLTTIQSIMTMK